MYYRYIVLVIAAMVLSACYLEGSSCSGPLCFSVGTEIDDDDTCDSNSDCGDRYRCPDAESVGANSLNALSLARQSNALSSCGNNINSGSTSAASLVWNETLFSAADRHARDMAANNFVASLGSDGVSIDDRVDALDSSLSNVSQLVAAGFANSQALISEWLQQSEECARLLDPTVTQYAMACRYDANSDFGTYWSLILATD